MATNANAKTPTTEPSVEDLMAQMATLQAAIEAAREREANERQAALMADTRDELAGIADHIKSMTEATDAGDLPAIIQGLTDVIMMAQALRTTLAPTAAKPRAARPRGTGGARAEVLAAMKAAPGVEFSATDLAHETGRSSGHVANELATLADDAETGVVRTSDSPKRYTFQPATDGDATE